MRRPPLRLPLIAAVTLLGGAAVAADDPWRPFDPPAQRRQPRAQPPPDDTRPVLAPMDGSVPRRGEPAPADQPSTGAPDRRAMDAPPDERSRAVERTELAPLAPEPGAASDPVRPPAGSAGPIPAGAMPPPAAGLAVGAWQGLDGARLGQLLAGLDLPPRSPALHALWRRLLMSEGAPAGSTPAQHLAMRMEGLYRSGLLADLATLTAEGERMTDDASVQALLARNRIGGGDLQGGCASLRTILPRKVVLPPRLRGDVLALTGYCGAATGNPGAAGLAAELAREDGSGEPFTLQLLDAVAASARPPALPRTLSLIDYRLLVLARAADPKGVLERADAPLLAAIAADEAADGKLRLAAAEGAARLGAIAPDALAAVYRAQAFAPAELADPQARASDPLLRRALLFRAAEAERTPFKKVRLVRALIDDARRAGLAMPTLQMLADPVAKVVKAQEIGWFAETAVEVMLASGRLADARAWVAFAGPGDRAAPGGPAGGALHHWLALVDIADPALAGRRGESLASVEQLALRGRFGADALHRLATVLDALDYNVPIPLWEAASKAPQPAGGHLPETGVLSELQDAARKKERARAILLAMRSLGPGGADGAHIIALGDTIRALRRVDLEGEARRIALEALFAGWPRTAGN